MMTRDTRATERSTSSASLQPLASLILGTTRILMGVLLACHGAQKVLGAFGGPLAGTPAFVVWVAGPIELVGGALLVVGLLARSTAFLMSGLMAFAYAIGHAGRGFWPILNGGELAIVYCWLSLYFATHGPGAWALDNRRAPRTAEPTLELEHDRMPAI
jgi:putative oxidoreductase